MPNPRYFYHVVKRQRKINPKFIERQGYRTEQEEKVYESFNELLEKFKELTTASKNRAVLVSGLIQESQGFYTLYIFPHKEPQNYHSTELSIGCCEDVLRTLIKQATIRLNNEGKRVWLADPIILSPATPLEEVVSQAS